MYSAALPAGLRTPGTHTIQWRATWTDIETGELVVDDSIVRDVTIDPAAPAYPGTVLVRLFRNTALLPSGDVEVDALRPDQAALLHVSVSWLRTEPFFSGAFVMEFRYQPSPGTWSPYQALGTSSEQSFCPELQKAVWHRNYGWS
jgi:hypothetical protein